MPVRFEVQLNDERPIRAGDEAIGVLTTMVTYVAARQEIELHVGGLLTPPSGTEHVE